MRMHCERCNVDFPEGLRYCKWCGQELAEPRRITSELLACPSCAVAVQPNWTFCKACGTKLTPEPGPPALIACPRCEAPVEAGARNCVQCGADLSAARESRRTVIDVAAMEVPVKEPQPGTAVIISHCSTCGEALDGASPYCKACGSPAYIPSTPFGSSSMLCGKCNSYSPVGATECRVCGAPLARSETFQPEVAPAAPPKPKKRSSTLPDLAEHLPEAEQAEAEKTEKAPGTAGISSGPAGPSAAQHPAGTLVFSGMGHQEPAIPADAGHQAGAQTQPPVGPEPSQGSPETTALPGVAGSKSERQTPTSVIQKKDTNPVEPAPSEQESAKPRRRAARKKRAEQSLSTQIDAQAVKIPTDLQPERVDKTIAFVSGADLGLKELDQPTKDELTPPPQQEPPPPQKPDVVISPTVEIPRPSVGDVTTAPFGVDSMPPQFQPETVALYPHPSADLPELDAQIAGQDVLDQPTVVEQPRKPEPIALNQQPVEPAQQRSSAPPATMVNQPVPTSLGQSPPTAVSRPPLAEATSAGARPAPPAQKSGVPILSAVVGFGVVLLCALAVWWFVSGRPPAQTRPAEPAAEVKPPAPPPQPTTTPPPAPVVPQGMVMVPAGTYTIGRDDGDPLAGPEYKVTLSPFFIDRTEVTNAEYKKFVDATGHSAPWPGGVYAQGQDNYPVTNVTWQDAADYAAWAGKRLPTEEEWEAAARGQDGRIYPWGNEWRPTTANIGAKRGGIKEVGQYPDGAGPTGALDLVGNVWEWTANEFELYPGSTVPMPSSMKPSLTYRVIRGGAFDGGKANDASYRGYVDASTPYDKTGFRCAKDAK